MDNRSTTGQLGECWGAAVPHGRHPDPPRKCSQPQRMLSAQLVPHGDALCSTLHGGRETAQRPQHPCPSVWVGGWAWAAPRGCLTSQEMLVSVQPVLVTARSHLCLLGHALLKIGLLPHVSTQVLEHHQTEAAKW